MDKESPEIILELLFANGAVPGAREGELIELEANNATSGIRGTQKAQRFEGVVIGRLVGLDADNYALVDFPANPSGKALPARSTVVLGQHKVGREIALLFEAGNPQKPIVIGLIEHPREGWPGNPPCLNGQQPQPIEVQVEGQKIVFTAEKEIVLRSGNASITLTQAGKVLIRGAYLLSRSSGVNRIKGGSVQIN